jgi:hypothetical protein
MLCRKKGGKIPASCSDLDLEAAGEALIRCGGSVRATAAALGVGWRDLRQVLDVRPELLDAALEAEERRIDEAQAVVLAVMRGGDPVQRIRAAGLFLRATAARRRLAEICH